MKEMMKTMVLWILTIAIAAGVGFAYGSVKGVEKYEAKWGITTSDNVNYTINVERNETFKVDDVEKNIDTTYIK